MNSDSMRWIVGLGVLGSALAHAGGIQVGAGSTVSFGDAVVSMGCNDLVAAGQIRVESAHISSINDILVPAGGILDAGAGSDLTMTGDFEGEGSFNAGTGVVNIVDGCGNGTSHIGGGFAFNDLAVLTGTGKNLVFDAGKTTTVTGKITLQGASGNLLKIRSTVAGSTAQISATDVQAIDYVDVADSRAVGAVMAPGNPANFHAAAGGNLFRWFLFDAAAPGNGPSTHQIPTMSAFSLGTLALLLGWLAVRRIGAKRFSFPATKA